MNLQEKANRHVDLEYPMGVEREYPKDDFKAGYNECKSDLTEFIRANPKSTANQILEYLEGIK